MPRAKKPYSSDELLAISLQPMHLLSKRSVFALIAGIVTAITGAGYLLLRRRPVEIPLPEPTPTAPPALITPNIETPTKPTRSRNPITALLTAGGGLACLITAQNAMLHSQQPVIPLLLYMVGIPLFIPILSYWRREWSEHNTPKQPDFQQSLARIPPYTLLGIAFFTILNIALSQLGELSPLLIFAWLINLALVMNSIGLLSRPSFSSVIKWLQIHRLEIVGLIGLMLITAWAYGRIPTPTIPLSPELLPTGKLSLAYNDDVGSLYHYLTALFARDTGGLRNLSTLFAIQLIPSTYLLAQTLGGKLTGIFAALLIAIAEWTLALGQSGGVYSAMAVCGTLFLFMLLRAMRNGMGYRWVGFTLGLGWLISPLFTVIGLLIPIAFLLEWQIENKSLRRLLINFIIGLVIAGFVVLPFAIAPRSFTPPPEAPIYKTGLSATTLFVEGLSRSLLMFNLIGDPNIQHGLTNRPVFAPALAAALIMGCLLWAIRLESRSRAVDWLFVIALVVSLIPSALVTDPLANTPDLQRGAIGLPIAVTLAAFGLNSLVRLLPKLKVT